MEYIISAFPIILTVVEMAKRFIPDKLRTYINPALALVLGIAGAFVYGGSEGLFEALLEGLGAAAAAVAAYKVPKVVGSSLGI